MSGYLAPLISGQLFDDNGDPLNGGLIYTYAGGTVSTPLPTYTTYALSVANANPIVCSSAGRAIAYIPAGTDYKWVVKNSLGVTLWTQDHVQIADPSLNGLSSGDLKSVGYAAIPTGFLRANGAAVSRGTYADLFAAIGTTFGVGDGLTTFNIPDMTGRFPFGVSASGTGNALAATFGAIDHTHAYTQVLNHTHSVSVTDPGHNHTQNVHGHAVTDPGHSHLITDPGHVHTNSVTTWTNSQTAAGAAEAGSFVTTSSTSVAGTDITIQSTTTGLTVNNATATNIANTTGISAATANPAGGVSSGTTGLNNPPALALYWLVKT